MTALSTPKSPARLAFIHFLRTGLRVPEHLFVVAVPLEAKFNPYHDPTNGQFTFGPGGGGAGAGASMSADPRVAIPSLADGDGFSPGDLSDGVYRPADGAPSLFLTGSGPRTPRSYGSNYGAFLDPMTLDQAFPGLSTVPGGSIIAVSANFLGIRDPAIALTDQMSRDYIRKLIGDIRQLQPIYRFQSLGFPETFAGQVRQINDLRWDRAAAIISTSGDAGPLQMETLRFLQERTDAEYDNALALAKAGRLKSAPTERMAIGNYVDRAVKEDFRDVLGVRSLSTSTGGVVRVNGREYDSSGADLTYSIPDARVKDVAFDITLAPKTLATRQIRQFFNSDFRPGSVVIIRPRQLGPGSTYIIKRPGK